MKKKRTEREARESERHTIFQHRSNSVWGQKRRKDVTEEEQEGKEAEPGSGES